MSESSIRTHELILQAEFWLTAKGYRLYRQSDHTRPHNPTAPVFFWDCVAADGSMLDTTIFIGKCSDPDERRWMAINIKHHENAEQIQKAMQAGIFDLELRRLKEHEP